MRCKNWGKQNQIFQRFSPDMNDYSNVLYSINALCEHTHWIKEMILLNNSRARGLRWKRICVVAYFYIFREREREREREEADGKRNKQTNNNGRRRERIEMTDSQRKCMVGADSKTMSSVNMAWRKSLSIKESCWFHVGGFSWFRIVKMIFCLLLVLFSIWTVIHVDNLGVSSFWFFRSSIIYSFFFFCFPAKVCW